MAGSSANFLSASVTCGKKSRGSFLATNRSRDQLRAGLGRAEHRDRFA